MKILRWISMAAAIGCCLVMAQAASAQKAQTVIKPGGVQPAVPDATLGMALMGAVVNSDGTLSRGSGLTSVSRFGTGAYTLNFDRSINSCIFSTTPLGGFVIVRIVVNSGTNVQINTNNLSGALADGAFSLIVFCPK